MSRSEVLVLKLGGSVLRTDRDLRHAVHAIHAERRRGHGVVAVVSALGDGTDRLLARARRLVPAAEGAALAAVLATGEERAAALLALALDGAGIPARRLSVAELGIRAEGDPLEARPCGFDGRAVQSALDGDLVVVAPGFTALDGDGRTVVLGRGGSDLSAVHLAVEIGARCRLFKDVGGVHESDPRRESGARRFVRIDPESVRRLGGGVVQDAALERIGDAGIEIEVAGFGRREGTRIAKGAPRLAGPEAAGPRLRVALAGLGTVGGGVLRDLSDLEEQVEIVGAWTRSGRLRPGEADLEVPLVARPEDLLDREPDVVIEALSEPEPARRLAVLVLRRGGDLITANKALIAEHGPALSALAEAQGRRLSFSAAVGGSTPMLELVDARRAFGIRRIEALVSGTSGFVLDAVADGMDFAAALDAARSRGFTERDAEEDVSGRDLARKAAILARRAFGVEVHPSAIEVPRLDRLDPSALRAAARAGLRTRLIVEIEDHGKPRVRCRALERESAFGSIAGEWNRIEIETRDGARRAMTGRGAGRLPTSTAIIGDLLDRIAAPAAAREVTR